MTKYRVLEHLACWVTFEQHIEADSPEQAEAILHSGEYTSVVPAIEPIIGDILDGYGSQVEVEVL